MVGDTVTLLTPQGSLTPMGVMPRQRRFKVVGTFRARPLRGRLGDRLRRRSSRACCSPAPTQVDHIEVKVAERLRRAAHRRSRSPTSSAPTTLTQDWTDINQQLYSALMLEKIGMGIGIGLIVMVAALNIVASLILLVMEKTRDIAILKTMGASTRSIMLIFLLQGTIIGVIGTVVGAIGGRRRSRPCSIAIA